MSDDPYAFRVFEARRFAEQAREIVSDLLRDPPDLLVHAEALAEAERHLLAARGALFRAGGTLAAPPSLEGAVEGQPT